MHKTDMQKAFDKLKAILKQFEDQFVVSHENDWGYYLNTKSLSGRRETVSFGTVSLGKSFVRFHLAAVSMFPDLFDGISPELKSRMPSRSSFSLKPADDFLFKELKALTRTSFQRFKQDGLV